MNIKRELYSKKFYEEMNKEKCSNYTSANEIVPFILTLFPQTTSVLDLGCGTATWLHAFSMNGVKDVTGIDGDWVDKNSLMIDEEQMISCDLTETIELGKKYDIAMSVEVGEHLEEKYADRFVDNLIRHSDVVVFGAAIPSQGGTHHVNEQWQSYWIEKFKSKGYTAIDPIRSYFWNNPKVMSCYAQNTIVYIKHNAIANYPQISKYINIPFVHDLCLKNYVVDGKTWYGKDLIIQHQKYIIKTLFKRITKNIKMGYE